jgi:hypothetical protein
VAKLKKLEKMPINYSSANRYSFPKGEFSASRSLCDEEFFKIKLHPREGYNLIPN